MYITAPVDIDASIYEKSVNLNTGLDQLLQIGKEGTGSDLYESRTAIKFDLSLVKDQLSKFNVSSSLVTASIKLFASDIKELNESSSFVCNPISVAWKEGSGMYWFPISTGSLDGISWRTVNGNTEWSSSFTPNSYYYTNEEGGTVWNSSYECSSSIYSLHNNHTIIDLDITSIFRGWIENTIPNYGVVIRHTSQSLTLDGNSTVTVYSKDSGTVFQPTLNVSWDSQTYSTGSLTVVEYYDNTHIYSKFFPKHLKTDSLLRIYVNARDKFPRKTFAQNSEFASIKALPTGSYYQIKDSQNKKVVIPYSVGTKISTNSSGSYLDLSTTSLYPERYYDMEIKVVYQNGFEKYFPIESFLVTE